MPLVDVRLAPSRGPLPGDVRAFVREAEHRLGRLRATRHCPAFIPSDFAGAYQALRALAEDTLAPGRLFCEWGSGLGVVAGLAAMLDFDACGIEIDERLVAAARRLASDFDLPVQFACGSFIPRGGAACLVADARFAWLSTEEARDDDELGLNPRDFDVIFAYPWPDEERLVEKLFERYARCGALLLTHHGGDDFRLRRKSH